MGVQQCRVGLGVERPLRRQGRVQQAAQRVHVGAMVDIGAGELLRRDVLERADHLAGDRQAALRTHQRYPEVRQVRVLLAAQALRDEDVGRLHVAVDERPRVSGIERGGDLLDDRDCARGLERPVAPQDALEIQPGDVAHDDVEATLVLVGGVDRDDMRLVERCRDARLGLEACSESRVGGYLRAEDLERDMSAEPLVARQVHDAHAAAADDRLDRVALEAIADAQIHGPIITGGV
jgi:hypothetical protein